jgi:glycosyltransferase involved in cell wall biosynthesis
VTSIVHLITDLNTGGSEAALVNLVSRLDSARFTNTIISLTNRGSHGPALDRLGVPVTELNMKPSRPNLMALWRLQRALRRARPDILQTWLFHADFLGLVAGRAAGIRSICWNIRCAELRKVDHPASLFFLLRILARLSSLPVAVVVNSEAGRSAHEALGYHPRRWEFIPNGIDVEAFGPSEERRDRWRQATGLARDTPVVGLVARYHPIKDHATFLDAAAAVAASMPDVHFMMAGRGADPTNVALVEAVARRGLAGRISLCGEVTDTPSLFCAFDVAVSASYSEAFPNVVGEAMACGVPCVVTDAGDSARIVGGTGVVVPTRDPAAMSAAIMRLLAMNPSARAALGREARARIAADYSLDRMATRYEALYDGLRGASRRLGN